MACLNCSDTVWGIFGIHVVQVVNYSVGTVNKTLTNSASASVRQGPRAAPFLPFHQSSFPPWGLGRVRDGGEILLPASRAHYTQLDLIPPRSYGCGYNDLTGITLSQGFGNLVSEHLNMERGRLPEISARIMMKS